MPIYEYRCQSCEHEFERFQQRNDDDPDACPECNGGIKRLISDTSFQLKGSGWYETDYARDGDSEADTSEPDAGAEATDDDKEDSSADDSADTSSTTEVERDPEVA